MNPTDQEKAALERLISIAQGDTGQSRHVADFLLAWWNAEDCGGFDLAAPWSCDDEICDDMIIVFGLVVRCRHYPDTLGYKTQFEELVKLWRPDLAA